jgi:transposase-like protein
MLLNTTSVTTGLRIHQQLTYSGFLFHYLSRPGLAYIYAQKWEVPKHGQLGSLLRREGLTYTQLSNWRKGYVNGSLTEKPRGPQANPNRGEVRRLEAENTRLKRKLEQAEAIIDAQKKLAQLLDSQKEEPS